MGPARPGNGAARRRVQVAKPVDVRPAHVGGRRTLANAAEGQAGARSKDEDPGRDDQHEAQVRHHVVAEEENARDGDVAQERDGEEGQTRTGLSHDRIAQEIGQVAAEKGQDETDGDLRLSQSNACERHDEGDKPSDDRPPQKAQDDASGGKRHGEPAHCGEEDGAVHRQVDDPGALGNRLPNDAEEHGRGRREHAGQADQDDVPAHASPAPFLRKRWRAPWPRITSRTRDPWRTPASDESSLSTMGSWMLPTFSAAKKSATGAARAAW